MKLLAVIFMIAYSFTSLSAVEVRNLLRMSPVGTLEQGDSVKIEIQLWPVENFDEKYFLNFKDNLFLESFYVSDVHVARSENNYDVIEIKIDGIAIKPMTKNHEVRLVFGDYATSFSMPLSIKKLDGLDGGFTILGQSVNFSTQNIYVISLTVLIGALILMVLIFRKKIKYLFEKKTIDRESEKFFQTLFHSANNREQFEEIYLLRNRWLKYLPEKNPAINQFFKTMEEHQYKRTWSKDNLYEVKDSFDKIRGGIK